MRNALLVEALRALGLAIKPGVLDVLDDEEKTALVKMAEAGRRHAGTDLARLDAAIRTLIDVRYDDDTTRSRARKALDALLNIKDALGDPADPDAKDELSDDPEDEAKAVADSKKADKVAKAKPKADDKAAAKPEDKPEASGGKSIELKIAASTDEPWSFIGTVVETSASDVTFDVEDDEDFTQITLGHDEIASFESIVAEHLPGKHNQKQHGLSKGARGRVTTTSGRGAMKTRANALKGKIRADQVMRRVTRKDVLAGKASVSDYRRYLGHEAVEATMLAESEADGNTWDVLLIQPGTSKNRRRYRREVLREAVTRGAFAEAKAYAPDGPDHFGFGAYGRKRGTKELVGWWTDVHYDDQVTLPSGKAAEGVVGTFNVSKAAPWLRTMLSDAWARGKPDLVGWSIVGDGDYKVVRGEDGRPVADVRQIDAVESIDPVANPAAGGQTLRLVASQEGAVNWQTLTLAEAVRGLGNGTILPDELKEHRPDLLRLVETFDGSAGAAPDDRDPAKIAEAATKAAIAKFQTIQMTEAKMALRPRLGEPVKARIREKVNAKLAEGALDEAGVEEIIKGEVEYVAQFTPAAIAGAGVTVTDMKSERDKMVEAAYRGLVGGGKDAEGKTGDLRFSLAKFYVDVTGDSEFSGKYAEGGRVTEAHFSESITTSSFGEIMGDSVTRRMLDYYRLTGLDFWRQIVNVGSVKDFRTNRRIRWGGYANLPAVAQGDPYTALTTPTDEEATYAASKRGGTEDLTMETIANDDLNQMREIPRRLGRAAAQTLHEFAFDFMRTNGVIYDGSALAVAGHNNLGSTALDATTLTAGRTAMLKQADMSNSKRLGINPRFLVVPIELEKTAYELTSTDREVGNANNTLNFIRTFGLSVIRVDYWTDTNNWWLVADPNSVPTIEIAFLNGNEEPELFVQDQPTVGNVFSNDKITYKIRHIYGGAVMDFRGFYGAIVA